jgi:hypothetical protein
MLEHTLPKCRQVSLAAFSQIFVPRKFRENFPPPKMLGKIGMFEKSVYLGPML